MTIDAPSGAWEGFYVPEIHDVHSGMQEKLDDLFGALPQAAQSVAALLIVPFWQSRFALDADGAFCRRLKAHPGEKILHGWTHSLGPDWWNWLWYGHDNRSEFARLSADEAAERVAKGKGAFIEWLGIAPRWFCAPRWAQSRATAPALQAAGFCGFQLRDRIEQFSGPAIPLRALNFDEGERRLQSWVGRKLREGTIAGLLSARRPFRLTLHPADIADRSTWRQVTRLIADLEHDGWRAMSLDDATELWRHRAADRQVARH